MRLVSWNVAGARAVAAGEAARVVSLALDLVCLQEVTDRAAPWVHEGLSDPSALLAELTWRSPARSSPS